MDPYALGTLCVERGLVTEGQLEKCLDLQRRSESWRRLGEILLSEGHLTGVSLANLLSIQQAMRRTIPGGVAEAAPEPPPSEIGWLLRECAAHGADSLLLGPGQPPAFRTQSLTEVLEGPPLRATQIQKMLAEALPPESIQALDAKGAVTTTLELRGQGRVRADLYHYAGGIGAVLRALPGNPAPLASLPVPPGARVLADERDGLVLLGGPARTVAAEIAASVLDAISAARPCHIVTVERSADRPFPARKARFTRREVGGDVPTFAAGIEAALRSDADVVYAEELRDPAAIDVALDAASRGRLVLGLVPTGSTQLTLERLLDSVPAGRVATARTLLGLALRAVLLVRVFPGKGGGEPACAVEWIRTTPGIGHLIRDDKLAQIAMVLQTSRSDEMLSMEESLARLLRKGKITLAEALEAANDPERLRRLAHAAKEPTRGSH